MNGSIEKILGAFALPLVWMGSFEWRLRNKVGKDRFADLQTQMNRIESHQWDMLKAQNIKPSVEPPEEIKNNSKTDKIRK